MTSTTRGAPTPALYWRRRLFVVGVVLALVLIVVNAVSGVSDPDPGVRATATAGDRSDPPDPGETLTTGPGAASKDRKGKGGRGRATEQGTGPTVALPTAPVLAEPEGECVADDISITPTVQNAVAGQSATIVLGLRTLTSPACTWQVSAESLAVRISVGDDEVWASRHCTGQLPEESVVIRQAVTSTYELRWNTRRSETGCPPLTEYAEPGDYRVTAAALGGEPADLVFELAAPTAPEPPAEPDEQKQGKQKQGKQKQGKQKQGKQKQGKQKQGKPGSATSSTQT